MHSQREPNEQFEKVWSTSKIETGILEESSITSTNSQSKSYRSEGSASAAGPTVVAIEILMSTCVFGILLLRLLWSIWAHRITAWLIRGHPGAAKSRLGVQLSIFIHYQGSWGPWWDPL